MHDEKSGASVSISIPVAWGDMDAYQHVNNAMYARWIESARIAFFTRVGLMQRMQDRGVSVESAAELAGFGSARDLRRAWRRHAAGTPSGRG
jgi:methylphosphotriester-DNA--protein-cysteine methyltransferase